MPQSQGPSRIQTRNTAFLTQLGQSCGFPYLLALYTVHWTYGISMTSIAPPPAPDACACDSERRFVNSRSSVGRMG
eukprot:3930711-Rhodomonas_salina.4